jgi:hypothetical protein
MELHFLAKSEGSVILAIGYLAFCQILFWSLLKLSCVEEFGVLAARRFFHLVHKRSPTKRALDTGDSVTFSSIFLALSFPCSQAESTPAPAPVTQTVRHVHSRHIRR